MVELLQSEHENQDKRTSMETLERRRQQCDCL